MIRTRVAGLFAAMIMVASAGCSAVGEMVPSLSAGCLVRAGESTVAVDLEQAKYSSIIAGMSVRRSLPARAASIALTTAYQESGLRNLDYGDRDSLGLFQQRPSQDWGTPEEIMDPHYSTGAFYDALVKIKNWQERDITEVAQAVQISGYPDAYRDHEPDGRALASALTGHSDAAVTCLDRDPGPGDAKGLSSALKKTFGKISMTRSGDTLTLKTSSDTDAWAYGHYAVTNLDEFGVTSVTIGDQRWQAVTDSRGEWVTAEEPAKGNRVIITFRSTE